MYFTYSSDLDLSFCYEMQQDFEAIMTALITYLRTTPNALGAIYISDFFVRLYRDFQLANIASIMSSTDRLQLC